MVKLIDSRSIDPEGFNDEKSLGLRLNKLEDIADSSNITSEMIEKYFVLSQFYQYLEYRLIPDSPNLVRGRVRRRLDSNIDSEVAAIGVLHAPLIIILISQMFLAIDCARSISRQVSFRSNRNGLSQIHIQFDTIFENTALAPGINRRPDSPNQTRPNEQSSRSSDFDQRLGSHFFPKNRLGKMNYKIAQDI